MDKPKAEITADLLLKVAALPEEEGWTILHRLEIAPGCSLLGDLALNSTDLGKLIELRATLVKTSFWLTQIATAPACPLNANHDSHAQFI